MKILVIEDKELHQASARETLAGHDLTIVSSYDAAVKLLGSKFDFEAVLSDLMMPMSRTTLADGVFNPKEQVPYGFILVLMAAAGGVKYGAVVTDTIHHQGPLSAALDHLAPGYWNDEYSVKLIKNFVINGAKAIFVHTPFVNEITKDASCERCEENPGVCSNCNGTGLNKNPDWKPRECHSCSPPSTPSESICGCARCKGTAHYDKVTKTERKDWGRVLAYLLDQSPSSADVSGDLGE